MSELPQDQQDVQMIELSIKEAQKIIKFGEHIDLLGQNNSFKTVIFDGYLRDEAIRCTYLLAEDAIDDKQKLDVMEQLRAIAHFRKFLVNRRRISDQARRDLDSNQEALAEIREAEGEEVEGEGEGA